MVEFLGGWDVSEDTEDVVLEEGDLLARHPCQRRPLCPFTGRDPARASNLESDTSRAVDLIPTLAGVSPVAQSLNISRSARREISDGWSDHPPIEEG